MHAPPNLLFHVLYILQNIYSVVAITTSFLSVLQDHHPLESGECLVCMTPASLKSSTASDLQTVFIPLYLDNVCQSDLKRNNVMLLERTLVTSVMNGVPAFYTNCGGGRIESSDIVRQASRPPPGET